MLIETQSGGYLEAVDDGTLTTAMPRRPDNDPDNMPSPQEILTIVQVSDSTIVSAILQPQKEEQEEAGKRGCGRGRTVLVTGRRMSCM